jgi:aspartyl-tRNA(Asn)/glutamyl-tRNA(Gln) amidotransferase subunit A
MIPAIAAQPYQLTIAAAAQAIRAGRLSCLDLVESCLSRIEEIEPEVKAWALLRPEAARTQARAADHELAFGTDRGPLHGIPIGVKDVYYTRDMETTAGSKILAGFVPGEDAAAVEKLRRAGAIILGKTATTEFACYDPAPTRNPRNAAHTPGGSSAGSAAAVAAEMCPATLGTQTSGSILRPAAYCGVVGLKPTYDLIDRHGIVPLAWSLDHVGPLARTVADCGLLLDALAGTPRGLSISLQGCRIGIPDRYFTTASPDVLRAFQCAIQGLRELGCRVELIRLPDLFEAAVEAGHLILRVEAATYHEQWFRTRPTDYSRKLANLIETGLATSAPAYVRAQQLRVDARKQMRELFQRIDLMATPATPTPAPEGLESTGDPVFNAPFSTLGMPSISVPMGTATNGLPLGLQLAARHFEEASLLAVAQAFSQ